ncbi:hypothetical protein HZB02_02305 [Candidatus Woesearchaeota archaeon]|nr:hypothetical protein [Candidatus Woesearchaeota archaeon]
MGVVEVFTGKSKKYSSPTSYLFRVLARKAIVTGLFFAGGYLLGNSKPEPSLDLYKLHRLNETYYITQTTTGIRQPITEDFQLGSLEYRLDGIVRESLRSGRENLYTALSGIKQ